MSKYSVNQHPISIILSWIKSGAIAVPEIQRPFVWNATQVRDFVDSLYNGYPVGYLITWQNPSVKLKDGHFSSGKQILIDGQQRVTALMAGLLGEIVINKDYKKVRITIAFNPKEKYFEVSNPAIAKNKEWLPDITKIISTEFNVLEFLDEYCAKNPDSDKNEIFNSIHRLQNIVNNNVGLIELKSDLDIETVTEIFIRINSKGVELSQADFAMSKIATNEIYGGNKLRKCIDYFCHLAVAPEFYDQIKEVDRDFGSTQYFQKMSWLRNENDDLYDPSYTDMLRVAFISEFKRGRLQDLVALLSGRNFVTREYEEEIAEESFKKLESGILKFMNETDFKRFLMILRSAGFIDSSMIRSQNAINFAYVVYLVLKSKGTEPSKIESIVRRWFVMSILTGRYSASPESSFDYDIRQIDEIGVEGHLYNIEKANLSDTFWDVGLPQQMNTSVSSSPYFKVYLATHVASNDKGFLSRNIYVKDLITHRGDVHHLFPRNYLKNKGLQKSKYNQIANYVMMQSEINIAIRDDPPSEYFSKLIDQCHSGNLQYGAICDPNQLNENLSSHCIPAGIENYSFEDYEMFLDRRRVLIAQKIRDYYLNL